MDTIKDPTQTGDGGTQAGADTGQDQDALIAGKYKTQEDLVEAHKSAEQKIHEQAEEIAALKKDRPEETPQPGKEEPQLDRQALEKLGVVFTDTIESKEQEQKFLQSRPEAEGRVDVLKALQSTEQYKGKTLQEIDDALKETIPRKEVPVTVKMGMTPVTNNTEKSIDEMTDAEFKAMRDAQRSGSTSSLKELGAT